MEVERVAERQVRLVVLVSFKFCAVTSVVASLRPALHLRTSRLHYLYIYINHFCKLAWFELSRRNLLCSVYNHCRFMTLGFTSPLQRFVFALHFIIKTFFSYNNFTNLLLVGSFFKFEIQICCFVYFCFCFIFFTIPKV